MPRYFFKVYDGGDIPDLDGSELAGLDAVREEAMRTAGQILRDRARSWTGKEWVLIASDQTGEPVLTLRLSATLKA